MPSRLYNDLKKELERVDQCYLPAKKRLGYTRAEQEQVRAYYVFCHAAVERYLEDACVRVVDRALSLLEKKGQIRSPILALAIAAIPKSKGELPRVYRGKAASDALVDVSKMLVNLYKIVVVKKNHGIRTDNVNNLLNPIGLGESDLDSGWLADMDSFGSKRGDAAHDFGRRFVAQHSPDPDVARNEVARLLQFPGGGGLLDVDGLLANR